LAKDNLDNITLHVTDEDWEEIEARAWDNEYDNVSPYIIACGMPPEPSVEEGAPLNRQDLHDIHESISLAHIHLDKFINEERGGNYTDPHTNEKKTLSLRNLLDALHLLQKDETEE
jgi:hypothetical protein